MKPAFSEDRLRQAVVAIVAGSGLALALACGEERMTYRAKVGDRWQNCDGCEQYFVDNCGCFECNDYTFDEENKRMLKCVNGAYKVTSCCPGGGSATCVDGVRSGVCDPIPGDELPGGSCDKYRCGC